MTSLLDCPSRRIKAYVVNLKKICEALRGSQDIFLILLALYGFKFIEYGKFLDSKCLKDFSKHILKMQATQGRVP